MQNPRFDMEQEELNIDPHYLKGFNNGYLIAKHDPQLAAELSKHQNDQNPYFNGLIGGKQEYEKEAREWAKSFSKGAPAKDEQDIQKER